MYLKRKIDLKKKDKYVERGRRENKRKKKKYGDS